MFPISDINGPEEYENRGHESSGCGRILVAETRRGLEYRPLAYIILHTRLSKLSSKISWTFLAIDAKIFCSIQRNDKH